MLNIDNVRKRYDRIIALNGLSLQVGFGEIVGLVGHNGAGKTTLIEAISGLVKVDGGSITVDGIPAAKAKGRIGVMPQHLALYPSITVREHLQLFGRIAGLRGRALRNGIDDLITALRLTEIADRSTGVLSGGQQRRTLAATALIHGPSVLLLDEPTAGADIETRRALLDLVKQRASEGAAVLYTTHYLPELSELQAEIAVISQGRIIARGGADELIANLPGEVRVVYEDQQEVRAATTDPTSTLIELLRDNPRPVASVEVRTPSLDDLYLSLAVDHAH